MAVPKRPHSIIGKKTQPRRQTTPNRIITRLYALILTSFINNNGKHESTFEIEQCINQLGRIVTNPLEFVSIIKKKVTKKYDDYWLELNDPDEFKVASFFEYSHTTLFEILSYIGGIENTIISFPLSYGFIVPFKIDQEKIKQEKQKAYEGQDQVTKNLLDIGFDYFVQKLIFTKDGITYIRYGNIKKYLTKNMVKSEEFKKGFLIATEIYLEYGIMYGSPLDFYNFKKEDYDEFPFFEDNHCHFFKDHTICPCNQEGNEGEYIEPTEETIVENFALKEILNLVSSIIYHNQQVEDKIEPSNDFVGDFLSYWTPFEISRE